MRVTFPLFVLIAALAADDRTSKAADPFGELKPNTWVKLSSLSDTPASPQLGYEGACVWDSWRTRMIRYGGHNQGGGGEQGSEIWTFDPLTAKWELKETNTSPPGICCGQQNIFDPTSGLYIRFPAFSGSHGWQWFREIYLNDASVWTYDLASNTWRNRRPLPAPNVRPLRCASWDSDQQVIVVFGGEGSNEGTWTYDPYVNAWTKKSPKLEPPGRSAGNMAYDAAAKKHVLFGTQFDDDPHTWLYDLGENKWTKVSPKTSPPTNKNDAVLTYDPVGRRVLCITKQTEGEDEAATHTLDTWAFNTAKQTWSRLDPPREPDPSGNRSRQFMFVPQWNVALLENCTRPSKDAPREQQVWAYRLANSPADGIKPERPANNKADKQPRLIDDLVVSVIGSEKVDLSWQPIEGNDIAGYEVARAVVDVLSNDQLQRIKSQTPSLECPSVGGIRTIGLFEMLTDKPVAQTNFTDEHLNLAKPQAVEGEPIYERKWHKDHLDENGRPYKFGVYAYRVRAVNKQGVAGGWSEAVLTIPSAPQHLLSREDGTTCHLKWKANPEAGIVGYRVYRMNGRFSNAEIPRLTPDPIDRTDYTDDAAGKSTRRYYVVAVDALGQEGFPSAPVWFEREWKRFYEPFTKDWHQ